VEGSGHHEQAAHVDLADLVLQMEENRKGQMVENRTGLNGSVAGAEGKRNFICLLLVIKI